MSVTYTPTTNFGAKDSLPANDPDKVIKGAEFTTEFTAIQSAFSSAAPTSNPTFTGTATFEDVTATGTSTLSTVDINGGAVDGTTIGATTPSSGAFTTLSSSGAATLASASVTGNLTVDTNTLYVDAANNRVGVNTVPTVTFHGLQPAEGEVVRLDTVNTSRSLKVGSFTTSVAGAGWDFDAASSAGAFSWSVAGAEKVRIDSSGNVGIGDTNPSTKLSILDSDPIVTIKSNDSTTATATLTLDASSTSGGAVGSIAAATGAVAGIVMDNSTGAGFGALNNGSARLWGSGGSQLSPHVTIESGGNVAVDTNTLYVDSTNNRVGVGTSGPATLLHIADATSPIFRLSETGVRSWDIEVDGGAFTVNDATAATERLRIDASGNVGINKSPSAFGGNFRAIELNSGSVMSDTGGTTLYLNNNTYFNGAQFIHTQTGASSRMEMAGGQFYWYNAPSGTGGTAAAFTERMRIDSSGNVGIGTSSPSFNLHVASTGTSIATAKLESAGTATQTSLYFEDGGTTTPNSIRIGSAGNDFRLFTGSSERMRIDASGNLLVGQTFLHSGAGAQLNVNGKIAGNGYSCRAGAVGAFTNNEFNIQWTGSPFLWVDSTNVGQISIVSDYRVKRNVETQTETALSRIEMLRPITYQYANYGDLFQESDDVQEGFLAHELAEVIPSAVNGEKDDKSQIQSLKVDALCSVMVKAIQELSAELNSVKAELAALKGV